MLCKAPPLSRAPSAAELTRRGTSRDYPSRLNLKTSQQAPVQGCGQEDPKHRGHVEDTHSIEAAYLHTLSSSKDCAQQAKLVKRAMAGLPNQERPNKINV